MTDIDHNIMRRLLEYDQNTGLLFWKERPIEMFTSKRACSTWNSQHAGQQVCQNNRTYGYVSVTIFNRQYRAHRIIWQLVHGFRPDGEVDHINGIRDDNRLCNLRVVSPSENRRNAKTPIHNKSGHVGVWQCPKSKRWHVKIGNKHLGTHASFDEACAQRKLAQLEQGYHENHGRMT